VSNFAFTTARMLPKRAAVVGRSVAAQNSRGQRLLLELFELFLCNGAAIEQILCRCDLVSWVTATSDGLDVLVRRGFSLPHLSCSPLGHALATRYQVNEDREEGEDDQENNPERLPPPTQVPVPEQVDEDLEEHHQEAHEEEGPNKEPEPVPEAIHAKPSA
jgi:hypothetical protein